MNSNHEYSNEELQELVLLTAEQLGLQEPYVVEKDLFVTKAISVLMNVENETFKLVFQGGTALAKAHKLTQRMSEDCDFRVTYKAPQQQRKKDAQRRLLREFRKTLLQALTSNGFELDDNAVKIRNEGQFISIRARYPSIYQAPTSLKPFLALELFLGQVQTPTLKCEVTSLIRQTLGDSIQHPNVEVTCMSILETAAEKWVALTRRVATVQQREHYYDQDLVRHVYDLAIIHTNHPLSEEPFAKLAASIVENDRNHFKSHSEVYYQDPIKAIKYSLEELSNNPAWKNNWDNFVNTMVYGNKPTYKNALKVLSVLSQCVLHEIERASC